MCECVYVYARARRSYITLDRHTYDIYVSCMRAHYFLYMYTFL